MIRAVLIRAEELTAEARNDFMYGREQQDNNETDHALLLWDAGFITGIDADSLQGRALLAPELKSEGHDLLATLRSQPVWERIKSSAQEKGIELTVDAVKALGQAGARLGPECLEPRWRDLYSRRRHWFAMHAASGVSDY